MSTLSMVATLHQGGGAGGSKKTTKVSLSPSLSRSRSRSPCKSSRSRSPAKSSRSRSVEQLQQKESAPADGNANDGWKNDGNGNDGWKNDFWNAGWWSDSRSAQDGNWKNDWKNDNWRSSRGPSFRSQRWLQRRNPPMSVDRRIPDDALMINRDPLPPSVVAVANQVANQVADRVANQVAVLRTNQPTTTPVVPARQSIASSQNSYCNLGTATSPIMRRVHNGFRWSETQQCWVLLQ